MASQSNGGQVCPGDWQVFGNADINGDLNVDGALTITGTLNVTGLLTVASLNASVRIKLTPTAAPPDPAAEGMLYADTDHKLYYYNGTDWKEVAFV